jgi:hypothetical protein
MGIWLKKRFGNKGYTRQGEATFASDFQEVDKWL